MAGKQKRYAEYRRPRKRHGSIALEIIIVLLLLILIAFFVFSRVFGGSVRITEDGLQIVLPDRQQEPTGSGEVEEPDTPPLVIEDPVEEPSPEPEPEPEPEPIPAPDTIVAVEVSVRQLLEGGVAQIAADAGANSVVITMKPATGVLAWSEEDPSVADAVRALAQSGDLHLVARVACFRDQALASARTGGPLTTPSGNVWYDYYGMRWVSPVSREVREYLIRLCAELTEMGFDELLLEYAGYPYFGETHVLGTNELRPEDLTAPVELFWQEVRMALSESGVLLSALVTDDMVMGTDEYSGMGPELLAQYADRVWVRAGETDFVTPLEQAGMEQAALRIVYIGGEAEDASRASIGNVIG